MSFIRRYPLLSVLALAIIAIAFVAALAGCTPSPFQQPVTNSMDAPPSSPASVANQTKLDEQGALAITLAYTAAAKVAHLAIGSGAITDKDVIARIGKLDSQAYSAVMAVREAYLAGNSSDYLTAMIRARSAVGELVRAGSGG